MLFHFDSFLYFLFRKRNELFFISLPLPPAALPLICVMQLEAHGLHTFIFKLWGSGCCLEKGEIQESSGRSMDIF